MHASGFKNCLAETLKFSSTPRNYLRSHKKCRYAKSVVSQRSS
jgi:hypothetical protein